MITLQYLWILIIILLDKHLGYKGTQIKGEYCPKVIEKLKKKNYKVVEHNETIFFDAFITVSWED